MSSPPPDALFLPEAPFLPTSSLFVDSADI
jgi:hypothetical protein